MSSLELLVRKIKSAEDLHSVVRTMKAMAAAGIRQYEKAVESLGYYHQTIQLGLQAVLRDNEGLPDQGGAGGKSGILSLVIGTDYGFAGQFNEEIINYFGSFLENPGRGKQKRIIVVGEQALVRLERTGKRPDSFFSAPSSLAGINPLVNRLLLKIDESREKYGIDSIYLFYNQPAKKTVFETRAQKLWPVDLSHYGAKGLKWPSRSIPAFTMEPPELARALVGELIYVNLYRALALSLAGENASRLAAMQAAAKKIDEVREILNQEFRQSRQRAITEELLDIVSGFEALNH